MNRIFSNNYPDNNLLPILRTIGTYMGDECPNMVKALQPLLAMSEDPNGEDEFTFLKYRKIYPFDPATRFAKEINTRDIELLNVAISELFEINVSNKKLLHACFRAAQVSFKNACFREQIKKFAIPCMTAKGFKIPLDPIKAYNLSPIKPTEITVRFESCSISASEAAEFFKEIENSPLNRFGIITEIQFSPYWKGSEQINCMRYLPSTLKNISLQHFHLNDLHSVFNIFLGQMAWAPPLGLETVDLSYSDVEAGNVMCLLENSAIKTLKLASTKIESIPEFSSKPLMLKITHIVELNLSRNFSYCLLNLINKYSWDNLTSLNLSHVNFSVRDIEFIIKKNYQKLIKLNLSNIPDLSQDNFDKINNLLISKLTPLKLQELDLSDTRIKSDHLKKLTPLLPDLITLRLNETDISEEGIDAIAKYCKNLQVLSIIGNPLETERRVVINHIAGNFPRLQNWDEITTEFRLRSGSKIRALDLTEMDINNTSLKNLAKAFSKLKSIKFSHANISGDGIDCLVKHCKKLENVSIIENCTPKTTRLILNHLPKLKRFELNSFSARFYIPWYRLSDKRLHVNRPLQFGLEEHQGAGYSISPEGVSNFPHMIGW